MITCLSYKPHSFTISFNEWQNLQWQLGLAAWSGSLVLFGCGIKNMSAVQSDGAENFYIQ
jgi:hypothetical protein